MTKEEVTKKPCNLFAKPIFSDKFVKATFGPVY